MPSKYKTLPGKKKATKKKRSGESLLGKGMAKKAANTIKSRRSRLEKALKDAGG